MIARRFIDATARRPAGWIGRKAYGGRRGAPPEHEATFRLVLERLGEVRGERCLEIGPGGGVLLERLLAAGASSVAGLDHSPDMIDLCRTRNAQALSDGRLELALGDAAAVPWPDATFTVALSANAFFFFERPQTVLRELHRVLQPGGRLVIATIPGPLPAPSVRNWWVAVWGSALHVHTDEEMAAMLTAARFDDVRVETSDGRQLAAARRRGTRVQWQN